MRIEVIRSYGTETRASRFGTWVRGALDIARAAVVLVGIAACSDDGQSGDGGGNGGASSGGGAIDAGDGGAIDASGGGASGGGGASAEAGRADDDADGGGESGASACAALTPLCRTHEMDTAAKMEAACRATEFVAVPLASGGSYGPVTIEGGPYGAKIDWNQGAGTAFVNTVNLMEAVCIPSGIDSFQEPAAVTNELKNTRDLDYARYTVFRPACMKKGERYPVITWANGTCGLTHGYAVVLGTIASHGFVIIASNSTWTATAPTDTVQLRALDYAKALDEDPSSALYQRLDLDKIGAMGHSQGASATVTAARDARVRSVLFWNSGASSDKPFLAVSGDRDVGSSSVSTLRQSTNDATKPGAWVYYHQVLQTGGIATGHLVLMEQPERVWQLAVAWWQWQLNGDATAKKMFVGDDCGLCNRGAEFDYGHNRLLQ
jgi:pimeloyl-ACP methyl ester carboxylesterase